METFLAFFIKKNVFLDISMFNNGMLKSQQSLINFSFPNLNFNIFNNARG